MKIVVLDGYAENPGDLSWDALGELGELVVYDRTKPEDILPRMAGAEAVYTNKTVLTREILAAADGLRFVGVLATGYNVVDVAAAYELGIAVTNIPAYGTAAVAQFTIALMLELCHRIGLHSQAVHAGKWTASEDFCFWLTPQMELCGKTLGLVGYGRIGQAVERIAEALGMNVIHHAPSGGVSLDELLRSSDVVSLHCPLTQDNAEMMNADAFSKMKRGALLINTARGGLVNENDLAEALWDDRLGGAAVDVVSAEPMRADNPLIGAKNCIITPHIAWAAKAARERLMQIAVKNLRAFLAGTPQNLVK